MLLHYMYNVRDLKRKHFTSMRQAPLHVYERGDTPTNPNVAMNEPAVPTAIIVVVVLAFIVALFIVIVVVHLCVKRDCCSCCVSDDDSLRVSQL